MSYVNMVGIALLAVVAAALGTQREYWILIAGLVAGLLAGQVPHAR